MTKAVALDVMGGDLAPSEILEGAKIALESKEVSLILVGKEEAIVDFLKQNNLTNHPNLDTHFTSEVIEMAEEPALAVRKKRDSSLVKCAELVREGRAASMVSAGNTGAAMASALFKMGRIKGVSRPAIATALPIPGRTPCILIDSGANADANASWLYEFGVMASIFFQKRYGKSKPKLALLSIGEEEGKGNNLVKEAYLIFKEKKDDELFEFIGNVEGRDLLTGEQDIVICDGFVGNVALKSLEGSLKFFMKMLLEVIETDEKSKEAGNVLFNYLLPIADKLDPESTGGACLLGVKGICVISHGSSKRKGISNAIRVANDLAKSDLVNAISGRISKLSANA